MSITKLEYTSEEIEEMRQEAVSEYLRNVGGQAGDPSPGSFHCHEVLHMSAYLCSQVQEQLMEHPSIAQNPAWFTAAHEASNALWHLYQMIGDEHLTLVDGKTEEGEKK